MHQHVVARLSWAGGASLPIPARGLLIGRASDCDVVLSEPTASRHLLALRLSANGVSVVRLGKAPVAVDGVEITAMTQLASGARIEGPGFAGFVEYEVTVTAAQPTWGLAIGNGPALALRHSPFRIGGAASDDLTLQGPPATAAVIFSSDASLALQPQDRVLLNGRALGEDDFEQLLAGDRIEIGKTTLKVVTFAHAGAATPIATIGMRVSRVGLTVLPRGGRLELTLGDGVRHVYLSERLMSLASLLLRPPPPQRAGELISHDELIEALWPRSDSAGDSELHVVVCRLRKELTKAGLDGIRLIERSPTGRALRFAIEPGVPVELA